jgi:hypothetical protein
LIMASKPNPEFGKRRPAAPQPAAPAKRSNHVALLLMGTFAVGGGAYALMPRENCATDRPRMASDTQPGAGCAPRGSTSSGGSGGSSSRSSFYGGDSSHSPSGASSESGSGSVTRGGFGSFAAHFSGGG